MSGQDKSSPEYIRGVFDRFDINGDGAITIDELKVGLRRNGIDYSDQEVYLFMREVDLDGNGEIDFNEFTLFWIEKLRKQSEQKKPKEQKQPVPKVAELKAQFAELDADGNGYITIDEIKLALVKRKGYCTDLEVYKLMREADEDGDGQISFDEFVVMMAKSYSKLKK
ncbi:uncharacterized protein LOC144446028 isoform X2 [Glandiceps talaboti]